VGEQDISSLSKRRLSAVAQIIVGGFKSERELAALGAELTELGRKAYLLRRFDLVEDVGRTLLETPLPPSVRCLGTYYSLPFKAIGSDWQKAVLHQISSQAAPGLRERVALQLGSAYFESGDIESASHYLLEAAAMARGTDLLTELQAFRYLAICRSAEGDHVDALKSLMALNNGMSVIRRLYPSEYLEHLNSIAVELGAVGKVAEARALLATPLASTLATHFPNWSETKRELDEIEAKGATAPPLIFAVGSVYEPAASQLEGESRAEVSIGTKPQPVPETVRAQAVPLAQPIPARSRAIATSYKREAIPLAAIPLVKLLVRRTPQLPAGTSENCSAGRSRPRALHDYWRYIRSKPARAPPTGVLPFTKARYLEGQR
jgi:hypothetical protein